VYGSNGRRDGLTKQEPSGFCRQDVFSIPPGNIKRVGNRCNAPIVGFRRQLASSAYLLPLVDVSGSHLLSIISRASPSDGRNLSQVLSTELFDNIRSSPSERIQDTSAGYSTTNKARFHSRNPSRPPLSPSRTGSLFPLTLHSLESCGYAIRD
jgi:hypothetical protein